jgi:hypothetical protein
MTSLEITQPVLQIMDSGLMLKIFQLDLQQVLMCAQKEAKPVCL